MLYAMTRLAQALPAVDDVHPEQPPGMEKISTLLSWLVWGVALIAFAVFIAALGKIALDAFQGRETQGVKVAVIALVVSIALGSAGLIMNALI